jgi:hypothetical protein
MAEDRIDSFFDLDKIEQERIKILQGMEELGRTLGNVTKNAAELNKEFGSAQSVQKVTSSMKQLTAEANKQDFAQKQLTKSVEKLNALNDEAYQQALKNKKEHAERAQKLQAEAKGMEALQKATSTATMSMGDMQRELSQLKKMSFDNLNPEQIKQVNDRMADLTDRLGKARAAIKLMSMDAIPMIATALRGVTAAAQAVIGTMTLFGVESERMQKLQQKMVALIGITQALKTVEELYKAQILPQQGQQ